MLSRMSPDDEPVEPDLIRTGTEFEVVEPKVGEEDVELFSFGAVE
jgi:hypothetical protein